MFCARAHTQRIGRNLIADMGGANGALIFLHNKLVTDEVIRQ